ncbi:MAG: TlpA family protein disulfide reductase [Treponema sp.]|jgi:thiol-disulfide isomerase/thioredoxin|nr:TlpA family protein disulfide reductase [Treponema sp.]
MKKNMIAAGILLFALIVPGGIFAEAGKAISPAMAETLARAGLSVLKERTRVPGFGAPLSGGGNISLKGLEGKVVFLNFWATWCGPCRQEMPSMENLYRRYRSRGLEILAVNVQENEKDVAAFMKRYKLSFPAAMDKSGEISGEYGIYAFPTSLILDRDGAALALVVGSISWDTPEINAAFEALLAD